MCGGGGGDGGASKREAERQAKVAAAQAAINRIFDGDPKLDGARRIADLLSGNAFIPTPPRSTLYDQTRQAVLDVNNRELQKQVTEARRQNDFELARRGLIGGGTDVKSNYLIDQSANEGAIKSAALADDAAAQLRAADEKTRAALNSQALSGIDATAVTQSALGQLTANAEAAKLDAGASGLGKLFDGLSEAYLWNRQQQGAEQGQQQATTYINNLRASRKGINGTVMN